MNLVVGRADLERIGAFTFPVWNLNNEGESLARLGRVSWWSVYFGFGMRVVTDDGSRWKLGSHESGGAISARLFDDRGQRIALGTIGPAGYGIHGEHFNYLLFPNAANRAFENDWTLSSSESQIARISRTPTSLETTTPVPLPAVVMTFVLVRLGIPGEKKLAMPSVQWTRD